MRDGLKVRILGSPSVQVGGRRVWPGPKQRALLAALVLARGQAVPASRLAHLLWDDSPPPGALATLRSHVAHLRQLLEPHRSPRDPPRVLVTEGAGYALRLDPGQLDALDFHRLVEASREVLATDPASAARDLRAALDLWAGPALGDLAEVSFAVAEAARLEELRRTARRSLVEAELALGGAAELIGELSVLVAEAPLDEEQRRLLAVALCRCGRRDEAAAVCGEGLRLLQERGLDSAVLQATQRAILQDALEPASAAEPPIRPLQLPADVPELTGRARETRVLRSLVERALTGAAAATVVAAIDGQPGIGKSALAVHVAHALARRFDGGVLYANLRGVGPGDAQPPQVLGQFLRSLGVADAELPASLEATVATYRSLLAARRVLVVLDNAADAAQVRPLLPNSPGCAALVTSRTQLADLDGAQPLTLGLLSTEQAVELLARFAGADRVARDPAAAERIAHQCGRLPLALRIAGARLRARPHWPLDAMAERLSDARQCLDELVVGDLAVRSSFLESYEALPAADRRLLRLLGLLDAPDVGAGVAAALLRSPHATAQGGLERLVSAQLVTSPAAGRYGFHDLARLFARDRARADERPAARRAALGRALGWYVSRARAADELLKPTALRAAEARDGPAAFATRTGAVAWLEAELPSLVAAARQAASLAPGSLDEVAGQLLGATRRYLDLRRHWPEWHAIGDAALQAARRRHDPPAEAVALKELGIVFGQQAQLDRAADCFQLAMGIARQTGDRDLEESLLNNLGLTYANQRRYREAVRCYWAALTLVRRIGARHREGMLLNNLGDAYADQGRYDEAVRFLRQSLAILWQVGDPPRKVLNNLGFIRLRQGRHEEAIEYLEQALRICRDLDDRWEAGVVLWRLGLATEATHGRGTGRDLWTAALQHLEPLGAPEAAQVRALLSDPPASGP